MAGRIPQQFIDDLLLQVDIVDVIDPRLPLKRVGRNFQACCPFHNEKTPSFTVSPDKQFYHCFGCGANGTAVGFLMDYEQMGFVESIHELADMVGVAMPVTTQPLSLVSKDIYDLLDKVSQYYVRQLQTHPQRTFFLAYLERRGLLPQTVERFAVGMAPDGWDNLLKSFGNSERDRQRLNEAGLLSNNESGRQYDRFRNRLMFPILDRRDRVVGFGGRTLDDSISPKYLNSPETKVFQKSSQLYGLFQARKSQPKLNRIIIVEGYMDVLTLVNNGITNAVATLGTAVTTDHLRQAMRTSPEIVFCFDGDRAGQQAAWHAAETALPMLGGNNQFKFVFLADGDDPDSFLKQWGQTAFVSLVTKAKNYSDFFFDYLKGSLDISSMDGRSRLVETAKPYLRHVPLGLYRDMLEQQLADRAKVDIALLRRHLNAPLPLHAKKTTQSRRTKSKISPLVETAMTILLQYPIFYADIAIDELDKIATLDIPGIKMLVALIKTLRQNPRLKTAGLLERSKGSRHDEYLRQLALKRLALSSNGLKHELLGVIQRLCQQASRQRQEQLIGKNNDPSQLTEGEKKELKSFK